MKQQSVVTHRYMNLQEKKIDSSSIDKHLSK
jgi:hypothetical protein